MGTVVQVFEAPAGYSTGTVTTEFYMGGGTTVTPASWAFTNPGTNLEVTFPFKAVSYDGSSNISIAIDWYAQTGAITGSVDWKVWIVSQAAGAAESMEAADNATLGATISSTVNGTAKGPTRASGSVTQANADSLAADSIAYVRIQRSTSVTTLADTAELKSVTISYSDGLANPSTLASGPGSSTTNAVAKWTNTGGTALSNSGVIIDASNNVTGMGTLNTRTIASWVDGPASSTTGRIAVYNGTTGKLLQDGTKLEADVVTGPASVTTGRVASFNGTTGKIIQDSGVLASALAQGPGSSVSGNIASWNGTGGLVLQDSGVSATAHESRHDVGGADTLFPGTWSTDDSPSWSGSAWTPKYVATKVLTASFTVTVTSFADVTGLTFTIPRAGSYRLATNGLFSIAGGNSVVQLCFNYAGSLTTIGAGGLFTLPGIGYYSYGTQVANNVPTWTTGGTQTTGTFFFIFGGGMTVSTSGTLSLRFQRSANTVNVLAGSSVQVTEM